MRSRTRRAKLRPGCSEMEEPMRLRLASFMPMMPIVEKWFFQ